MDDQIGAGPRGSAAGVVVAFEGLDGAGKSTQCDELHRALTGGGTSCEICALFAGDPVDRMLREVATDRAVDPTASRYAVISKLLSRQEWLVRPRLRSGGSFIYDKYLLSFLSKEIVSGADVAELRTMIRQLDPPDVTIVLDTTPAAALARKDGMVGYYEAGLNLATHQGAPVTLAGYRSGRYPPEWARQRFLAHQQRLREAQQALLAEAQSRWDGKLGRSVVVVPSGPPPDAVAATVRRVVQEYLTRDARTDPLPG